MIKTLFHELGAMELCLMIKLKISCVMFVVSSSIPLRPSALIPLLFADFPFLRLSIAIIISFMVNSGMYLSCSLLSISSSTWLQVFSSLASPSFSSFLSLILLEKRSLQYFANMLVMPFLVASMFPPSFLTWVMRVFSGLDACDRSWFRN